MPVKYYNQIRDTFISVLEKDSFYYNVDPDPAIAFVMKQMDDSYESISKDLDFGVRNGIDAELQLSLFAEAVSIYLGLPG